MRRRVVKRIIENEPDRSERMLQAAVDTLREALGARVVHGFSLGRDGELHGVAVSPAGRPRPANIAPKDHPESVSILCKGAAGVLETWSDPDYPECSALLVPWWSEEGPVGAALAVIDQIPDAVALRLAAAHGASVGSRIAAERFFASELLRLGMLEQLSTLLEAAFASTSDAVVQIDLDGVIRRWNAAAEQLYGWRADEVIGKSVSTLDAGWTRFARSRIRETALDGRSSEREMIQCDKNGTRLPVRMTLLPLFDETGNASSVVAIARPTGHPAGSDGRRTAATDLTDVMVREITGPLTAVIGYADLLSRSAIQEDAEQRARVTRGLRARCEELARLLEDFMLLSRLGGKTLEPEVVDLAELCRTLVTRNAAENRDARARATAVLGEGLARADRRSAEASVRGLLRCVSQQCSADANVEFRVSTNGTTATVHVDVREPDAAAAADLAERLEDLIDHERTGEQGLGLQVARLVAEAHGGTLTVVPAAPFSSFTLELPAHMPLGPAEEERWKSTMV
ncbi:MAG: hypothetical protein CVT59_03040 [Actinobacteria bacterium HGW-Actinobacteria-1]|nr:MAG: hypothetical protein CVT59_03040 [Actinobacteria bacterium HGW-Actinobacteria-1]